MIKTIYIPIAGLTLGGMYSIYSAGSTLMARGSETPDGTVMYVFFGAIMIVVAGIGALLGPSR